MNNNYNADMGLPNINKLECDAFDIQTHRINNILNNGMSA